MKFTFKNIDDHLKLREERIGDIQPKYWYIDSKKVASKCLVKRQFSLKVNGQQTKSRMFNHFGEYFGYLLGKKSGIDVCPVELVTVHDTKNKYSKTRLLHTACASYSVKEPSEEMYSGEFIVSKFKMFNPEQVDKILQTVDKNAVDLKKGAINVNSYEDNVELILASIAWETKQFEQKLGKRTETEINEDIATNLKKAFEMIIYDCLLGNSDRHSGNWSMIYNNNTGKVSMYPNYDNEAILGLRKPECEIKKAVQSEEKMRAFSENELYSRMGISPINSGVTYKNMLEYLVRKYPVLAIPTIKKVTDAISVEDIAALYDSADGITKRSKDSQELSEQDELPPEFKTFGVNLYSERKQYALTLVREFKEHERKKGTDRALELAI